MIEIKDLKKNYGDFKLDISLQVPEGAVTGLIGKNGAGKSAVMKAILGLIRPDGGTVKVMGKDSQNLTTDDKVSMGVALADSGFSQYIKVKDVIRILRKMYRTFDEDTFREQCRQLELPLDKKIKDFSTGMRAKLRVLTAISHGARLLILDEPTAGLDVLAKNEILNMLHTYLEEDPSRSILISSHISSDLEGFCDDLYMIHEGKLILHEDTDRILGNYGILKMSESDYERLDKEHLIATKKEGFGYACLTKEKQYYQDNYPNIVTENGNIDSVMILLLGGKEK